MDVAEDDPDPGPALADVGGDLEGIHEARGGRREADHFRIGRQHDLGILGDGRRRMRAEAVVQLHAVAEPFQPGSELHDADRRHAVGQHREIGLAGDEIEARRVNQGDAHDYLPPPTGSANSPGKPGNSRARPADPGRGQPARMIGRLAPRPGGQAAVNPGAPANPDRTGRLHRCR